MEGDRIMIVLKKKWRVGQKINLCLCGFGIQSKHCIHEKSVYESLQL